MEGPKEHVVRSWLNAPCTRSLNEPKHKFTSGLHAVGGQQQKQNKAAGHMHLAFPMQPSATREDILNEWLANEANGQLRVVREDGRLTELLSLQKNVGHWC